MAWRQTQGILWAALATTWVCTTAPLAARPQDPARPLDPPAVFKSETDVVVLHVNVFDHRSDAVPDLPLTAFHVLEDDRRQTITYFSDAEMPVAVGLILDNSGSMIARQQLVLKGGAAFTRTARPEDELFTIHFNEHVQFGLPPAIPFTSRQSLLQAALARYRPAGRTALYDAVIAGLEHLERATHQKRVLVVLSDGEDNASRHSEDEMLARARASDAIIYTVSSANERIGLPGRPGVLRKLADISGVAYFPRTDEKVVESLDDVAGNIRRGYTIGYVSTNPAHDGTYRRVKVMALVPGRIGLDVRTRDGYRAPTAGPRR